jgi:hypothetical protein
LGYDIEVGDKSTLQDDGDIGRIEELDGIGRVLTTITGTLDRQIHSEALQKQISVNETRYYM